MARFISGTFVLVKFGASGLALDKHAKYSASLFKEFRIKAE